MIVEVKCLICDERLHMGCVIGGKPPLKTTYHSCSNHNVNISITTIADDKFEEWYKKEEKKKRK